MPRINFRQGQLVIAKAFTGPEIIGEYRGRSNNFGCYVFGHPEHSLEPNRLFHCITLTLKALQTPKLARTEHPFSQGDPCVGYTKKGLRVVGHYIQPAGEIAYVRAWKIGNSILESPTAIRVLKKTLTKPE